MPTSTANLISYGVPFRLLADSPALLAQSLRLVPHATTQSPLQQGQIFPITPSTLQSLRTDLMVHVADHAPNHVFLHAAVVAIANRAIVLPGPSHAGKTTLTAALVRAGATYYSDEYAILQPSGLIEPYARDLQIRTIPGEELQTPTPVEHLQGKAGTAPIRAALIAFIDYFPKATWSPETVTPGMAVLEMLRHTIPVQRTPARVLSTLTALVANTTIFRTQRDEADQAAHRLLADFAQHPVAMSS